MNTLPRPPVPVGQNGHNNNNVTKKVITIKPFERKPTLPPNFVQDNWGKIVGIIIFFFF